MAKRLTRTLPKISKIWDALQAGKTRRRIYPADQAAIHAISHVLMARIEMGKKLHTLTIAQVMESGDFTYQTSKSAIKKLLNAGVIKLTIPSKFNPETGTTFAGLYEINVQFLEEAAPKNLNDLWMIYYSRGGDFEVFETVRSQIETEYSRVTVDLMNDRLMELESKTQTRLAKRARYGN